MARAQRVPCVVSLYKMIGKYINVHPSRGILDDSESYGETLRKHSLMSNRRISMRPGLLSPILHVRHLSKFYSTFGGRLDSWPEFTAC